MTSLRIGTALAAIALLAGCGIKESITAGDAKVAAFHADLDAGRTDAIWNSAGKDLTGTTDKARFIALLNAVHSKLGKLVESKRTGWNANTNTNGTFVALTMQSQFEHGSGQEEFVYRKVDDKLQLAGYHIQSNDMMVR